jgi:bacterioferritin-associated ferredoxin
MALTGDLAQSVTNEICIPQVLADWQIPIVIYGFFSDLTELRQFIFVEVPGSRCGRYRTVVTEVLYIFLGVSRLIPW